MLIFVDQKKRIKPLQKKSFVIYNKFQLHAYMYIVQCNIYQNKNDIISNYFYYENLQYACTLWLILLLDPDKYLIWYAFIYA